MALALPLRFHDHRFEVDGSVDLLLEDVHVAGQWMGGPPTRIAAGIIVGFLRQEVAEATPLIVDYTGYGYEQVALADALPGGDSPCPECGARDRGWCGVGSCCSDTDEYYRPNEDFPPYRNVHNGNCGWWMHFRFEAGQAAGSVSLMAP
jgi:hypothetical protein